MLSDRSLPGGMKRMIVDQFLMSGKVIGFDSEVLLGKRLRAGRGAEIGAIGLSLLLRGNEPLPSYRMKQRIDNEEHLDIGA